MKNTNLNRSFSTEEIKQISLKIKENIFKPTNTYKTTIFLCGASLLNNSTIRSRVAETLSKKWYFYRYDIIYPEDIFDELLYGTQGKDLLSLEGLLAESVDAIVLIPESPGSFAELGAFANDNNLRTKIICILDKKHKKDKSFINQGPVKLIKKASKENLLYIDLNDLDNEIEKLGSALSRIKKTSTKKENIINLLQLENFLLPTIYLLEPIDRQLLQDIVGFAIEDDRTAIQSTITALTILTKKRKISSTPEGYKLTPLGIEDFVNLRRTKKRSKNIQETKVLDELRLEIMNVRYRNKKLNLN